MVSVARLSVLVLLVSCGATATSDKQAPNARLEESSQTIDEQPTQASAQPDDSKAVLGKNDELRLRRGNADRINAETTITAAGLADALPGRQIKEAKESVEGEEFSVFEVYDGDELLFVVEPYEDSLATLTVKSARVRTAEGVGVGSTFLELENSLGELECIEGDEDYSVNALCTSGSYENIRFAFLIPNDSIYEMTKAEIRRALGSEKVVFVWWQAP